MASRYNKVMVVEVGGIDEQIENTYQMLIATIKAVKTCQRVGCYFWEPQGALAIL
jgi:arabinogalactan endo-1,4-beta-galactosidase